MKLAHYVFLIVVALMVLAPVALFKGMIYVLIVLMVVAVPLWIASLFIPRQQKR
jgi:uncharacterized membrane protein YdbT with pleckstrin-like domain